VVELVRAYEDVCFGISVGSERLIDMGAVRRMDDEESAIYGTVGYQAPEVAELGPSVASDLYTVARTLAVLTFDFQGYTNVFVDSLPEPPVIGSILLDLARRQTNNSSLVLARAVVSELGRMVPLLEKPHRAAGFAVLTAPDVPSVLVELGCLSNPREEHLLQEPRYRRLLVQGLLRAIDDYFAAYTAA